MGGHGKSGRNKGREIERNSIIPRSSPLFPPLVPPPLSLPPFSFNPSSSPPVPHLYRTRQIREIYTDRFVGINPRKRASARGQSGKNKITGRPNSIIPNNEAPRATSNYLCKYASYLTGTFYSRHRRHLRVRVSLVRRSKNSTIDLKDLRWFSYAYQDC